MSYWLLFHWQLQLRLMGIVVFRPVCHAKLMDKTNPISVGDFLAKLTILQHSQLEVILGIFIPLTNAIFWITSSYAPSRAQYLMLLITFYTMFFQRTKLDSVRNNPLRNFFRVKTTHRKFQKLHSKALVQVMVDFAKLPKNRNFPYYTPPHAFSLLMVC